MINTKDDVELPRSDNLPGKFLFGNLLVIAVLFILAVLSFQIYERSSSAAIRFLSRRLLHDAEMSIPTLYNYALIIFNCCTAAIVALKAKDRRGSGALYWGGLSLIFFLMSFDEAAQLHEKLIEPMQDALPDSPFLTFAWTPVGAAFVLVFALLYAPFLKSLPKTVAVKMILAGAIYVAGALGFETFGGWVDFHFDRGGAYHLLAAFEESFEMIGMVVFGSALLLFIQLDKVARAVSLPDRVPTGQEGSP